MQEPEQPLGLWQYFMLLLSIIALTLLAVQTFFAIDQGTHDVIILIDHLVCGVFFADFVWHLIRSRSRMQYLKWGWLDFVSSIPMIPELRVARLARVVRIIRVLRGARASKHLLGAILLQRARNVFVTVLMGSFVLVLFSSIAIINVEPSLSPREGIWWCIFTLITGEYNDFYPISTEGRVIAALLMTAGMAIFGTFTATVASIYFEVEQKKDEERDVETLAGIDRLTQEISDLKNTLKQGANTNVEHPQKDS